MKPVRHWYDIVFKSTVQLNDFLYLPYETTGVGFILSEQQKYYTYFILCQEFGFENLTLFKSRNFTSNHNH